MFVLRNILHNKLRLLTCYTNHDVTAPALTKYKRYTSSIYAVIYTGTEMVVSSCNLYYIAQVRARDRARVRDRASVVSSCNCTSTG